MEQQQVLVSKHGRHAWVLTLNRARKLNSLSLEMVRGVTSVLRDVATAAAAANEGRGPQTPSCILIKGACKPAPSAPAFCAGGDVRAVRDGMVVDGEAFGDGESSPLPLADTFFREEYCMNFAIAACPRPVVSIWHGVTMGGGVGISVHGALRIATEATLLAMPECKLGFFPDVGVLHVLSRLGGASGSGLGAYIALTGARLKAADLVYAGLATHYVPAERLAALEMALTSEAGAGAPACGGSNQAGLGEAAQLGAIVARFTAPPPDDLASSVLMQHREAIDRCFGQPTVEAIISALQREGEATVGDAKGGWIEQTLQQLHGASPTSLKVTLAALQRAASTSLAECLKADFRISQALCCIRKQSGDAYGDFFEGVRAILVDKQPDSARWVPSTLDAVTEAAVENALAGGARARQSGFRDLELPTAQSSL